MSDTEHLDTFLDRALRELGGADLLRVISARARGLAEQCPDDQDEWIDVAAATAQAAEALSDDEDDQDENEDEEDGDDVEGKGDDADDEEKEGEDDAPEESAASSAPPLSTPPGPRDQGDKMMRRPTIKPPRPDVTEWRARRVSPDAKTSTPCVWGSDGVQCAEWPLRELSYETLRSRWGAGTYRIHWFGREDGRRVAFGTTNVTLLPNEEEAAERSADGARSSVSSAPIPASSSADLLGVIAALRPSSGPSALDLGPILQILAFMDHQQEKERARSDQNARLRDERYRAELEAQLERERIAAKERIAQIEATAQIQARVARGVALDPEVFAEAISRKIQEILPSRDDDEEEVHPAVVMQPAPSDLATVVNSLKEVLAPLVTVFVARANELPNGSGHAA